MGPAEATLREKLACILEELERYEQNERDAGVVSAVDLDAVIAWLRSPELNLAEELAYARGESMRRRGLKDHR